MRRVAPGQVRRRILRIVVLIVLCLPALAVSNSITGVEHAQQIGLAVAIASLIVAFSIMERYLPIRKR
jgi:hypothetical protein